MNGLYKDFRLLQNEDPRLSEKDITDDHDFLDKIRNIASISEKEIKAQSELSSEVDDKSNESTIIKIEEPF